MRINADLEQPASTDSTALPWVPSPMPGVERRMLDRIGEEVARATSLVRYAPDSRFPRHTHGGGEEFLVLEGVFSDEHGDYPAGTYVRNPVGSSHSPFTATGCTILVKLWQMSADDQRQCALAVAEQPREHLAAGVEVVPLHRTQHERVAVLDLQPGAALVLEAERGLEAMVLQGAVRAPDLAPPVPGANHWAAAAGCAAGWWLRLPGRLALGVTAVGGTPARLFLKRDHLGRA